MYKVVMVVEDVAYVYGRYDDSDRASEVAMQVRDQRQIDVYVEKED